MALINALFIDDDFFYDHFPLPENVERKNLLMTIKSAQSIRLVDLVGTCLYDDIEAKFIAETLSSTEQTLVEMMRMVLVYYTAHEMLELVRSERSLNKGEENRDPLAQNAIEKARYWEMRIVRYIKQDDGTGGLYETATADGCDDFDKFNEDITDSGSGVYYPADPMTDGDCSTGIYLPYPY